MGHRGNRRDRADRKPLWDAAGHSCIAVVGPAIERAITLETGSGDRQANMRAFATRAFSLIAELAAK